MLYQVREWQQHFLQPMTRIAQKLSELAANPFNPWSYTAAGQHAYAGFELLHRLGKEYEKPTFDITSVIVDGKSVGVTEHIVEAKAFCQLREFVRDVPAAAKKSSPTVLVCAPLSGHHSTLLRDTVRTLLQDHNVFITDWIDARMVPLSKGPFGLDDYVTYIQEFIRSLGSDIHLLSVCQPTVPVLAAVSLMASNGEKLPRSMTMMGGPIDTRESPTGVNDLATERPLSWFENSVIYAVPTKYPGYLRKVYPGFLQHAGFVAMNPNRHATSHWDYYLNLLQGDDEDAEAHRKFYDEYNAVLDLPAEFYLDTIKIVFQEHALPNGTWHINGQRVAPEDIKSVGLLTIEGELDDISGLGQTRAALKLCSGIPNSNKQHYTAIGAGHYGIFSGRRWREMVYPQVRDFIAAHQPKASTSQTANTAKESSAKASAPKTHTSKANAVSVKASKPAVKKMAEPKAKLTVASSKVASTAKKSVIKQTTVAKAAPTKTTVTTKASPTKPITAKATPTKVTVAKSATQAKAPIAKAKVGLTQNKTTARPAVKVDYAKIANLKVKS